jgi:hypothetical protein
MTVVIANDAAEPQRVAHPGYLAPVTVGGEPVDPTELARIHLPATFVAHVNSILAPGATVLVTDESLSPQTTGAGAQVMDADPPNVEHSSD